MSREALGAYRKPTGSARTRPLAAGRTSGLARGGRTACLAFLPCLESLRPASPRGASPFRLGYPSLGAAAEPGELATLSAGGTRPAR